MGRQPATLTTPFHYRASRRFYFIYVLWLIVIAYTDFDGR